MIERDNMNSKKKVLIPVLVGFVLLMSYFIYEHIIYVSTDNAQIQAKTVLMAAKVSGYVQKVNVVENQKVKTGDVLVEIDPRDYENTFRQVSNELAGVKARQLDVEKNYRRISDLFQQGAVSQQQLDNAKATADEVNHKFQSLQAQVSQAQLNLDNTKITAPSDGVVAKKSVEVGMLAAPGMALIGFVSAEERWVAANFKETELKDIHIGSHAEITVDALSGKKFSGKVESISSATGATFTLLPPDNATGNFTKVVQRVPVKIIFDHLQASDIEELHAGLSAEVKVRK